MSKFCACENDFAKHSTVIQQPRNIYDSVGIQSWTVANKKLYLHRSVRIPTSLPRTFKAYDVYIQQNFDVKVSLKGYNVKEWINGRRI
jgi:hypothetical protein